MRGIETATKEGDLHLRIIASDFRLEAVVGLCHAADMCYSKEVSLAAGTVISVLSYWYYLKFYLAHNTKKSFNVLKSFWQILTARTIEPSINGFSLWFILGFAAIGGHQLGEFASIATGSQFVYKLGLISSIACTYFMLVAFEKLSGKLLGSKLIAFIILMVSIDIFRTEMIFENTHFWVRGTDHKYWAIFWLANWLYLCLAISWLGYKATSQIHRRIYWLYGLCAINVSFMLSWAYAILAHRYGSACTIITCSYHFLSDFIYEYDFPSLWCTFTVIQAPFIYLALRKVRSTYTKEDFGGWKPTWRTQLGLVAATILLMYIWYTITPLLLGVSWKMMTK
jgi:hypothetical protein